MTGNIHVLIVAEHVSFKMGGEAARPLHYFRYLRQRGVQVWMLVHARTRGEIQGLLSRDDFARVHFVPDTKSHRMLWKIGSQLPHQLRITTTGALSHLLTQRMQRHAAKRLVRRLKIDVVHEPIPISPKQPSMMYDVGAPVVIGPLNGDINYPPAFAQVQSRLLRGSVKASRIAGNVLNRLIPGKLLAHTVLVSNERTRKALPTGIRGRVMELVANAVDMTTWKATPREIAPGRPVRFAFMGRLVDFKMVDLLLEAFEPIAKQTRATLDIIGQGPEREKLRRMTDDLGLTDYVHFPGWLSPADSAARLSQADVFVFPSLRECGGAAVVEAMAIGVPVIAANWGGPADYVGNEGAGILIDVSSRDGFVSGLRNAMQRLAESEALRREMSGRAKERAVREFDWTSRISRLMEVYALAAGASGHHG